MNQRTTLVLGIILAALAVVLGAFGAHAFKTALTNSGRIDTYELAVRYQFYHAFALLITGLLMNQFQSSKMKYAAACFTVGVILFSGSLYFLCLTDLTVPWFITPLGGIFFIAAWIFLLLGVIKK
jgi:uncharacterized membrane protein YgdD (TMEM256/DUF423 family)